MTRGQKNKQAPAQDERLRAAFMEGYQQGIDSEFSDPEAAWNRSRTIHLALDLEQARPAQTAPQQSDDSLIANAKALLALDERGSLAPHGIGGLAREVIEKLVARVEQTAPQPEQDDSLNMEPEGANAYLVVDPEDNYHICYVVRSKDQALQHATGGLLAFGPITQGGNS